MAGCQQQFFTGKHGEATSHAGLDLHFRLVASGTSPQAKHGLQSSLGALCDARSSRRPYEEACPVLVNSKPALHREACSRHQHNMAHQVVQKLSCSAARAVHGGL